MGKPGLAIMIGVGRPKPKGSLTDSAFADYMRERGKKGGSGGDSEGGGDEEESEDSAARKAGEEAAQDFIDAQKAGDAAGVYEAFCRMAEAHAHDDSDEENAEDEGDSGE